MNVRITRQTFLIDLTKILFSRDIPLTFPYPHRVKKERFSVKPIMRKACLIVYLNRKFNFLFLVSSGVYFASDGKDYVESMFTSIV
jgi:hypothetical protein